jgi:hypothetical protein
MHRLLLTFVVAALSGCGPAAYVGRWQFDVRLTVETPQGPQVTMTTEQFEFVSGKATGLAWLVKGCEIPLESYQGHVEKSVIVPTCNVRATDKLFFNVSAGRDGSLDVTRATFALVTEEKPPQTVHKFGPGEPGLTADFEVWVRPPGYTDPNDGSVTAFKTTTGYGYRVD